MKECDCMKLEFLEYGMDNKLYRCSSCKKLHIVRINKEAGINEHKHER